MKKKRIIIISLIVLFIIILVPTMIWGWREREKKRNVMYWRNEGYCHILSIKGEFCYTPNTVEVIEMEVDERQLLMDVVLYNEYNESDKITVEQVLEEYDNFCNNSGTTEGLDALYKFALTGRDDKQEHPISRYNEYIKEYLEKEYGIQYVDQASMEQLEEAAKYAAERWHNWSGEY